MFAGKDARILRVLTAAYAETGQFTEAATTAEQALGLARDGSDARLVHKLQAELKAYESGAPYRSTHD